MKYLTVIPARGGSKGIPLKNIYKLNGVPMILYTINAAIKARLEGDIVVSTDSPEIAAVVKDYKQVLTIDRPKELASDTASTEDALIHALTYMEAVYNSYYDAVVTMQPTSPLRTAATIKSFLLNYEDHFNQYDASLTLTENRTDFWVRDKDKNFSRLYPEAPRRRQERQPLYEENSALYVTKRDALLETKSVLGIHCNGFVIPSMEGIDINEYQDLVLAEYYLKQMEQMQ